MVSVNNKENFFFFCRDCSDLVIKPNSLEHAYLAILNDDLFTAKQIFRSLNSPRAKWGEVLVASLAGYLEIFPTYFQLRNFFEIDLDFLLKNEKLDYVELLLGALEIFAEINQETYKFVARVMYANNLLSVAFNYMQKSKEIYYHDPELHFMLSKYFYKVHDYKQSEFYIDECLKLLPDYYPALLLKQKIDENEF